MAKKASRRRKGNLNPLGWLTQAFDIIFKLLQRIMNKLSGKETVQKAKSLGETVAQQQSMVKDAEEAFATDMQRAERNFDEAKRTMDAHKMAMGLGTDPAGAQSKEAGVQEEATKVADGPDTSEEKEQKSHGLPDDSEPAGAKAEMEEAGKIPLYTEVRKSLPKVVHHAIGGLAINGKAINPYDTKQWFTEGELKTQFDQIKAAINDKAVQLANGKELETNKEEIQQLLFEKLAGSLLGQRTTDANDENQAKLGVALALLLHEASAGVNALAAQLEGIQEEEQVEARVTNFQNHFFSSGNLKLLDEKLKAFVLEIAPDDPEKLNVLAIKSFQRWFANQAPRYQVELDEGHSILSGQDYHGHTFFVAPEEHKEGSNHDDTQVDPQVEITDAEYTEHHADNHVQEGKQPDISKSQTNPHNQAAGVAEQGRVEPSGEDPLYEEDMGEVQHADEMPFGKHRAPDQAEAQMESEPAQMANEKPLVKPTVVGDVEPYIASMTEEQFEAVNDSTIIADNKQPQKLEEGPKPAPPVTNGRSYGDAPSVPVNDDFTF